MSALGPRLAAAIVLMAAGAARAADDFSDLVSKAPLSETLDGLNRARDSCRFVETAALEAFAHDKLAGPPVRSVGSRPDANGSACRYWFSRYRSIEVSVSLTGGDKIFAGFKVTGTVIDRAFGTAGRSMRTLGIEGDWDEIILLPHHGIGALQGDLIATIAFFGFEPTPEEAVPLMNAIYGHLAKPVDVDGSAGIAAALDRDGRRPHAADPCGLASQAEIERILGTAMDGPPRQQPPHADRNGCEWTYRSNGLSRTYAFQVTWRDGYDAFELYRTTIAMKAAATRRIHAILENQATAHDPPSPSQDDVAVTPGDPSWDFATFGVGEAAAVRSDVLVWTYAPGASNDQLLALERLTLARTMATLSNPPSAPATISHR